MTGTPVHRMSPEAQRDTGLLASYRLLRRLINAGLDWVFPPRCVGCGRVDFYWCADCERELAGIPLEISYKAITPLQTIASTGAHRGILREAVQGLKYGGAQLLQRPLGERLIACFDAQGWTINMVVPVPLHTTRLAERGYNQSQLLAEYVASGRSIPSQPAALTRQRNTSSQVGLGAQERLVNVADAFHANSDLVAHQTLLLIDDVCTTGATLSACAQAALEVGAAAVYGLTVTSA